MKFKLNSKMITIVLTSILLTQIVISALFKHKKKLLLKNNKNKYSQIPLLPFLPNSNPLNPKEMMHFFATNAKNYAAFARLAYCRRPIIENFSCSFCNNFQRGNYNPFFIHSVIQNPNRVFQMLILYSDLRKEIVISFSGPSSEHGNFFTSIYLEGFIVIPEIGNLKVEKIYWDIYNLNFRNLLIQKIQKFLSFGRADYRFIFVGHSFGGSLATLASYDLVFNRIIPKNPSINSPQIFTYGQLRIGDNAYIRKLNTELKIVRILKKNDFIAQMPNCVFLNGGYKCFDTTQALINVMPQLRTYIDSCGNPKTFFAFLENKSKKLKNKKNHKNLKMKNLKENNNDPIVRGTTMIAGDLVPTHKPIFYSQPLGTELFYAKGFEKVENCGYVNGIPVCEKGIQLPKTFTPEVHRNYYNMNLELC